MVFELLLLRDHHFFNVAVDDRAVRLVLSATCRHGYTLYALTPPTKHENNVVKDERPFAQRATDSERVCRAVAFFTNPAPRETVDALVTFVLTFFIRSGRAWTGTSSMSTINHVHKVDVALRRDAPQNVKRLVSDIGDRALDKVLMYLHAYWYAGDPNSLRATSSAAFLRAEQALYRR